jgi:hypothetical protein
MGMLNTVLSRCEFQEFPPVLVDVGASSGLNPGWKALAKYSICIAFDADDREMASTRRASKVYRELYVYNRALTSGPEGPSDFYLTQSPSCSSLLRPNHKKLSVWEYAERFRVCKKTSVQTVNFGTVLSELKLGQVDWFKTDSQGTDLRLFLSLGSSVIQKLLVAEFEPGIIDAYEGEDKLWEVMRAMDERDFWMADIEIKGSNRINKAMLDGFGRFEQTYMLHLLKVSPGWAEVLYLNSFTDAEGIFSMRDYLLGWVCASLKERHGFALELAVAGEERFEDAVFDTLKKYSLRRIRTSYANVSGYFPLLIRALRKWKRLRTLQWFRPAENQGSKFV